MHRRDCLRAGLAGGALTVLRAGASARERAIVFAIDEGSRGAALFPGLGPKRLDQPCFVLQRA
jgi:hypothetical protein